MNDLFDVTLCQTHLFWISGEFNDVTCLFLVFVVQ